jgi:serine/threonine protein kinase
MLPRKIGRYHILEQIGSGGMSVVYLGRDAVFDRPVAVKVLSAVLGEDPGNRERFRREAKAIAMLEHAAVVPVYDYGEDGGRLFLVLRYMQGGSLKDRLTRGRLPPLAAAGILRRIASALDKAHAMSMIHRDIKPGNILFDREDNPYITDFGLVKMTDLSLQLSHSKFFGTPAYTSPEQCQEKRAVDSRADVYSLTAVFFHMLTGSPPYQAEGAMALLMKHVSDPIPHLADSAPELPPALQAVIDRGMAKSPVERFATAGRLAEEADRILSAAGFAPIPEPAGVWGGASSGAGPSLPATESSSAVSFDRLRRPPADDVPTRREPLAQADAAAPADDSEATRAMRPPAEPNERRRLEWTPQADTPPPATHTTAATGPAAQRDAAYRLPHIPPPRKSAGIPILAVIVILLVFSILYFAFQKGLF